MSATLSIGLCPSHQPVLLRRVKFQADVSIFIVMQQHHLLFYPHPRPILSATIAISCSHERNHVNAYARLLQYFVHCAA